MDSSNAPSIPASPPAEPKPGFWSKVFSLTPVILTIIATTLAGFSSSELTQSMYFRSLAAQNQSKAGDQWSFFQVKRIRGTTLESSIELMQSLGSVESLSLDDLVELNEQLAKTVSKLDAAKIESLGLSKQVEQFQNGSKSLTELLNDPTSQRHLNTLFGGLFPAGEMHQLSTTDPKKEAEVAEMAKVIEKIREEIAQRKTESDTAPLVARVKLEYVEEATQLAEKDADGFDRDCVPLTKTLVRLKEISNEMVKSLKRILSNPELQSGPLKPLFDRFNLGVRMAITDFNARRYQAESTFNRRIAELYEVRVRRNGVESDRHRKRSTYYFYSMIAAQAGVTVASLALARTRKSLLWLIAVIAGLASIAFAGWLFITQFPAV